MSESTRSPDLLAILAGRLDEEQRAELEEQALSDDRLFEELASQEDELIDAYLRGDLSTDQESMIASLVAASPRLQESAELGAALSAHSRMQPREAASSRGREAADGDIHPPRKRLAKGLLWLALLVLAAASVWQTVSLRGAQQQLRELQTQLETVRQERDELQQERKELELDLARERAQRRLQPEQPQN